MVVFLLFSLSMIAIVGYQYAKKELDEINSILLLTNALYGGAFYLMSVTAENPDEIKGALIFAFIIFYVFFSTLGALLLSAFYFLLKLSVRKVKEMV